MPEDIFFGEFLDNGLHLTGIEAGKREIVTGHGGQILEQVPTPRQIKFGVRVLYYYAENPSQAGKNFSTDGKRFVILRVFVVDWVRLYHEGAKTRRIAKFLVAALKKALSDSMEQVYEGCSPVFPRKVKVTARR
ncbi:MAG: hypothetical protein DMG09_06615 [Acidobacteria bacterium]|nr:MAG: hypothetical protein DMG09_06615 [Acidobacteriota bacterium]